MATDYDALYRKTPDALGAPARVFVDFFDAYERAGARVLDIGCGQGRDALFIARLGHRVTGVDLSPNGIACLRKAAHDEALDIAGHVADIRSFEPDDTFDVILIDRTLHMLAPADRLDVLARLLNHTNDRAWVLIADEPRNIAAFQTVFPQSGLRWETRKRERGYLFMQRAG